MVLVKKIFWIEYMHCIFDDDFNIGLAFNLSLKYCQSTLLKLRLLSQNMHPSSIDGIMLSGILYPGKSRLILSRHQLCLDDSNRQINNEYKFKIYNSQFGKGCFAEWPIEKGETICFFEGEELCWEEFYKRYIEGRLRLDDPLQISETEYIQLYKPYIYFNHSCNPNSGFRGQNELIAIKNIKPGEEIFYDYSTVSWDDRWTSIHGQWAMKCECREKNCRYVIGDFPTIPESQKVKYFRSGVIPNFILEKITRDTKEYLHS